MLQGVDKMYKKFRFALYLVVRTLSLAKMKGSKIWLVFFLLFSLYLTFGVWNVILFGLLGSIFSLRSEKYKPARGLLAVKRQLLICKKMEGHKQVGDGKSKGRGRGKKYSKEEKSLQLSKSLKFSFKKSEFEVIKDGIGP